MSNIYLAFDYGERRIGTAVGDDLTGTARAQTTLNTGDWAAISKLVADWRPAALILGLPLDESGGEQPMSLLVREFAVHLQAHTKLPVHLCDERFSSREADDVLRGARASGHMSRRVRKGDRDGEAARIILEQWLAEAR
jgi:putative Holliday junction resolvase